MKTLLIDNHDSFTYNLFQLLGEVNGEQPIVVRNDEATWPELAALDFDNVVLSPGPGRPDRDRDFGVCADAIASADVPLLGVCLGHQGIGRGFGAAVEQAPEVVHGRADRVTHGGHPLFAGIPSEFEAVRYHSLCIARPLPRQIEAIARTGDGTVMAVAHRSRPLWGVQFHPESICTEHGTRLIANFRDLTARLRPGADRTPTAAAPPRDRRPAAVGRGPGPTDAGGQGPDRAPGPRLRLEVERLDWPCDPAAAFAALYGDSPASFWLDSASHPDGRSRFSFMGDAAGPHSALVTYDVAAREVAVERSGRREVHHETIFEYLARELDRLRIDSPELPFDFDGGFVGYLGYELKADCDGDLAHESPLPDAAFVLADRLIAFDHVERRTYLVCLTDEPGRTRAQRWIEATRARLAALGTGSVAADDGKGEASGGADETIDFRLSRSPERYLDDIARCKELLAEGETYEVCLTNRVVADVDRDPLELYRALRRANPAPYSAFLRFGDRAVLSSSPERFLRVDRDRWAEAKPIKGTTARAATPAEDARVAERLRTSEKDRAENLMVTDLLRNDLGSVCEIGSVHVPALMRVETYETVHQLVSTVRGRLRAELGIPGCIRACFPAGSMTGAPKRRTMKIIDELEGEARGVYSGAVGYLGLGGGCDLSVVIRTIVLDGTRATIGAGGAIVMQSDAEAELREAMLKAAAPMRAIDPLADLAAVLADDGPVAAGMQPG
ncbi:MAG: aminodeoxychorismate synthase component I [Thermoleophilaceae bacterium]